MRGFVFVLFVLSSGLAFGGEEKFAALDSQKWELRFTGPGSGAQIQNKRLLMLGRPYVFSKEAYKEGTISFDVVSNEPTKSEEDGRLYSDRVLLLLASSGKIRAERSYEPLDGIIVALDMGTGRVEIQTSTGPGLDARNFGVGTAKNLTPKKWHKVVVKDEDGVIVVSVDGTQVATGKIPPETRKGNLWGFSNREPVGPGVRASSITNVTWGK